MSRRKPGEPQANFSRTTGSWKLRRVYPLAMISFTSAETHLLINPRMPADGQHLCRRLVNESPPLSGHVWMATSGSTGVMKLAALSKAALLASAAAVNRHLQVTRQDRWCLTLPTFHVGGLGIEARAFLDGNEVVTMERWNAAAFAETCEARGVTLSALVPTHVSDLVRDRLQSPPGLRAIVIGGSALDEDLYLAARSLGWNLLPSYGMTECASQAATASLASLADRSFPRLDLLDHLVARTEEDGRLTFRGTSLLTGYASLVGDRVHFADPKVEGWFVSQDMGEIEKEGEATYVKVEGRRGEMIKIGGELVSLSRLDSILGRALQHFPGLDAAVVAVPDQRLGSVIHLAGSDERAGDLQGIFNRDVLPFERVRTVHLVERIPRSPLGKLLRAELLRILLKIS